MVFAAAMCRRGARAAACGVDLGEASPAFLGFQGAHCKAGPGVAAERTFGTLQPGLLAKAPPRGAHRFSCAGSHCCKRGEVLPSAPVRWCMLALSLAALSGASARRPPHHALPLPRLEFPSLLCPGGLEDLLPEQFFPRLEMFQSRYSRDSLQRSVEFLFTMWLPKISHYLDEVVEKCPAPVLEIMMNSVLACEVEYGLEEAAGLYQATMRLAGRAAPSDPLVAAMLRRWQQEDTASTYPVLLGLGPQHQCYGSALKVYVYDVPGHLTSPSLDCAHGQWGTEVLFHKFFLGGACRTHDPEEAHFFYVPIYATCLTVKRGIKNDTDAAAQIWDPLAQFLHSSPWFHRRAQRDHVFLFADGQSARIWDASDWVRSEAILMFTESKCPTWDEPLRRYVDIKACSSGWKDIIIPGHTDFARARRMLSLNLPTEERDILMTFHGRHAGSHDVYWACEVRSRILEMGALDGVDVGGFVDDYLERKGRSHFCLIPGGTSPWTNHLYESFFCGCIPVILSDEYDVAFQHILDWPRFSIKWPEAAVGESLYSFLRSFQIPELRAMKDEVDAHACWFDYHSSDHASARDGPDEPCSPFYAVLHALEARREHFPLSPGRFWNAGPALDSLPSVPQRTTRFHTWSDENAAFLF